MGTFGRPVYIKVYVSSKTVSTGNINEEKLYGGEKLIYGENRIFKIELH